MTTIVVPLDGSALAENALPLASSLAQRMDGTLRLLRVIPPLQPFRWGYGGLISAEEQLSLLQTEAESYLAPLAERFAAQGVPVTSAVVQGLVGETIVSVADECDASYIMMSTHGRGGLARWALGSVAGRVLHLTERPLVLLPPQHERPLEQLFPLPTLKRIVVPLDGSREAEQILAHIKPIARVYDAELLLVRSVTPVPMLMPGAEIGMVQSGVYEVLRTDAQVYLQRIQSTLEEEGYRVRSTIGMEPAPMTILEVATRMGADLIAMTSHAREGLSRLILGSVTDRVVRAGELPVLVTRLRQGQPRDADEETRVTRPVERSHEGQVLQTM
jgi:nucleotide-binding universal stress UspA family protein